MDVKSSHEKPTWHDGEFYPELITEEACFFSVWNAERILPLFRECFLIGNVCLGFCWVGNLWHDGRGRNGAWQKE